jgi:biotin carboxyl carrier protein
LKGTSSAEPDHGHDDVSDNDNDETEPGAQSRKASGANFQPKDKDKDPLSPEEAAKLRAHMAGMFGRCATLLVEYGEEIQDPNKVPTVPLEVIQTQIGKIHGSRFASLLSKGVR